MRVLVTGHLGYVGGVLTPLLRAEGFDVAGLDSDLYRRCGFGPPSAPGPTHLADVRDATASDLEGFDAVLHLAGLSNDPLGDLGPRLTDEINHVASVRLAALARDAGVKRFVLSSSCSVYGDAGEDLVSEESEPRPLTAYAESKLRAEAGIRRLASPDFSPVCLRHATAYGLSHRMRFDLVLNNLVAWAVTTGKVLLKSDGSAWRPVVHVEDLARAFVAVLKAPSERVHDRVFNVGQTAENHRVVELARIVADAVPGCRLESVAEPTKDARGYRVSCDAIRRALPDYRPRWNAALGAKQLYEAYLRHGVTPQEFEGPR